MPDLESFSDWVGRWKAAVAAVKAKGPAETPGGVAVEPGATEDLLDAVEAATGAPLPRSLRSLFLASRMVDVAWFLDQDVVESGPFPDVSSGICAWNVAQLVRSTDDYRSWVANVFPDSSDPSDIIWQEKYPFMNVVNGDIVSIAGDGRVVYLSHDGGAGHGYTLGADVSDFLDRWAVLGCPGPEDWQWLPFTSGTDSGLEPDGANGRAWREWLGLP